MYRFFTNLFAKSVWSPNFKMNSSHEKRLLLQPSGDGPQKCPVSQKAWFYTQLRVPTMRNLTKNSSPSWGLVHSWGSWQEERCLGTSRVTAACSEGWVLTYSWKNNINQSVMRVGGLQRCFLKFTTSSWHSRFCRSYSKHAEKCSYLGTASIFHLRCYSSVSLS